jgi:uncharacterized repeat protein (TIGR03803 family)
MMSGRAGFFRNAKRRRFGMKAKGMCVMIVILFLGAFMFPSGGGAAVTVRHTFSGGATDGANPVGGYLVQSGTTLYGMTYAGGSDGLGTIFKIETDGTGFSVLHSFTTTGSDGTKPYGSLTISGSTLYGMTSEGGGIYNSGTIFKINTAGTGLGVLHTFTGGADGGAPLGELTLDGTTLYGMTYAGGSSGLGTIFKINTDGTGFGVLHTFTGGDLDGSHPIGSLTISGSTLYGMTSDGGNLTCDAAGCGVVFSITTAGGSFTLLHEFAGGGTDGRNPGGSLKLVSGTLYGMTNAGGDAGLCTGNGCGTIFSITTAGGSFTLLHEFAGGGGDGSNPGGSLTYSGSTSTLYGTTREGGDAGTGCSGLGCGTIFSCPTTGCTGIDASPPITIVHEFTGDAYGSRPATSTLIGTNLWGMTNQGGSGTPGLGVIFTTVGVTLIDLISFHVAVSGSHVAVSWKTGAETDTAGFHLWRSTDEQGDYARITQDLIPSEGGPLLGATYRYIDQDVQPGKTYFYKLEDIDTSGESTFHGPFRTEGPSIALLSPEDKSLFSATPPTFRWNAQGVSRCRVQFSGTPDFTGRVITTLAFREGVSSYTPGPSVWRRISRLKGTGSTLFWRVFGRDKKGTKAVSESLSFDVQ